MDPLLRQLMMMTMREHSLTMTKMRMRRKKQRLFVAILKEHRVHNITHEPAQISSRATHEEVSNYRQSEAA